MDFRIYPNATEELYTPYKYDSRNNQYGRIYVDSSTVRRILIRKKEEDGVVRIIVDGADRRTIIGKRLPNRRQISAFLNGNKHVNKCFNEYFQKTIVVPTYPLSIGEAYVKTIIRQIIRADQAKILHSKFIKKFGPQHESLYGYPTLDQLRRIPLYQFQVLRLGIKAIRIWSGLKDLNETANIDLSKVKGVGLWTESVLRVEIGRDYSLYPFWDKSGQKIKEICCINLSAIAKKDSKLAGDLYLYAVSFFESLK